MFIKQYILLAFPNYLFKWLGISLIILFLDQFSKIIVMYLFSYGQSYPITNFLNIMPLYNQGAAFNFLATASGWQRYFFIVVNILTTIYIVYLLKKSQKESSILFLALTLILGGAIGNVIDRVIYGYVIDFLDLYINSWHWPTFNIADSAICIGVILYLINEFFVKHEYVNK